MIRRYLARRRALAKQRWAVRQNRSLHRTGKALDYQSRLFGKLGDVFGEIGEELKLMRRD